MKKLSFLSIFVLALLVFASNGHALQTKAGNYDASDEVWSNVRISTLETTPVVAGVVVEFSASTDTADENAWIVTVADASADHSRIAGVAQETIATGDFGRVLLRGKGQLSAAAGVVSSGDYLYASSTAGAMGVVPSSGAKVGAIALESKTNGADTIDAYITVI